MVAQYGSHLNLMQVHMPDEMAQNFLDDDALRVLLHNQIPLDWVDHAYTYSMVYLEQQFHSPTMSMNIFHEIDDKHIQRLSHYGTLPVSAPLGPVPVSQEPVTNIATSNVTMALESGEVLAETAGSEP
ncbi:hypothetical protein C0995_011197 [Termitomyces sp. Mi166|nr:hypothetical protein C0995_011197 [Termitomyces sp. Mi166\